MNKIFTQTRSADYFRNALGNEKVKPSFTMVIKTSTNSRTEDHKKQEKQVLEKE